jgi:hypothetical protein
MTNNELLNNVRALMNDQAGQKFTNTVLLAYYNMARMELQELFEQNEIPVNNETSAKLDVPAGTSKISFSGTTPVLPSDLVEIQELWCSQDGQDSWVRVAKREFLTQDTLPSGTQLQFFNVWAWMGQSIHLLSSINPLDIKIDYVRFLFSPLVIGDIDEDIVIINSESFLQFRTAGLASEFIDENTERADKQNGFALMALDRVLGINTKGAQSIVTRRRPFRASYKRRGIIT